MANNDMELTEALNHSAGNKPATEKVSTPPTEQKPASRQQTKLIGGHFDKAVHHQLKLMALEEDLSIQHLLGEALDYLFVNRGKPPIAKIAEK